MDERNIIAPHKPDAEKLASVIAAMQDLGSPEIRCVWNGESYIALEGSHRIAAAAALGLPVHVIELDEDDDTIESHDFQDIVSHEISEILDYLGDNASESPHYYLQTVEI